MPIVVRGMENLLRAIKVADRDVRLGIRREIREAVEPIRRDAELLTDTRIRNMGPPWSRMRVGIAQRGGLVYVVPRKRGVKPGDPAARPNVSPLILDRAFEPALQQNQAQVIRNVEAMLDTMATKFNRS